MSIKRAIKRKKYCCPECDSCQIQLRSWSRVNTEEFVEWINDLTPGDETNSSDQYFCDECQEAFHQPICKDTEEIEIPLDFEEIEDIFHLEKPCAIFVIPTGIEEPYGGFYLPTKEGGTIVIGESRFSIKEGDDKQPFSHFKHLFDLE